MPRTVYALLVGINDYQPPVSPLRGAVNDAAMMRHYLEDRVAGQPGVRLELHPPILNERATYQAIIDGFESHLARAEEGDVALFFYAGHGSRAKAPPELWPIEPDRKNETLVCYDSREPGKHDLADKELAALVAKVARPGVHMAVILDCCHSGSGTRKSKVGYAVRQVPEDERERPIESFYGFQAKRRRLARKRSLEMNGPGWPTGRHVLLAACQSNQLASEYRTPEPGAISRGAFSYFLGETLQAASGPLTYRELAARASSLVGGAVLDQDPQLESVEGADLSGLFLDGTIRRADAWYPTSFRPRAGGWRVEAGALQGLPAATDDEPLEFALYPFDGAIDGSAAAGRARAVRVGPNWTPIELLGMDDPGPTTTFKAVVTRLPIRRLSVRLEGSIAGKAAAREALSAAGGPATPSLFLRECPPKETPDYRLIARGGEFIITRPVDDRPLVREIEGVGPGEATLAVRHLEHIARWTQTLNLVNKQSRIKDDQIKLAILRDGQELEGPPFRLEYVRDTRTGNWVAPRFKARVRNEGDEPLFVALLNLTESFGVFANLQPGPCVLLNGGEEFWAHGNREIPATIPKEDLARGKREYTDHLKLIVSTSTFDTRLLSQDDLGRPRSSQSHRSRGRLTPLDRLMQRVRSRALGAEPEWLDDWWSCSLMFTTTQPPDAPDQ